jgi:multiple sugar transport system permease protein
MTLSNQTTSSLARNGLYYGILLMVSFIVIFPLILILSSSFKTEAEIVRFPMTLFPTEPTTRNFQNLRANFPIYILNSFKVTLITVILQLLTASTGAYAFTKLQWRGRELIFLTYIATFMVPIHGIIIPQFMVVRTLGLYDSHAAVILVSAFTAFGTFLIKQFFMTIPDSLLEAAKLDGASEYTIFLRIMIPLSKPVLATVIIFSFRFFWNDFFIPLIYLVSPNLKTLPLGMSDFVTQYTILYGPQMAAALISIIPVMIIFFSAQRYFVEGMAATGLKG